MTVLRRHPAFARPLEPVLGARQRHGGQRLVVGRRRSSGELYEGDSNSRATSLAAKRRCPPGVRIETIFPASAQLEIVRTETLKILATSAGVIHRSSGVPIMVSFAGSWDLRWEQR